MYKINNELQLKILKYCIDDRPFFLKFKDVLSSLPTDIIFVNIINVLKTTEPSLPIIRNELSKLHRDGVSLSEYENTLNELQNTTVSVKEKSYIENIVTEAYEIKLIQDTNDSIEDLLSKKQIDLSKIYNKINEVKRFKLNDVITIDHAVNVKQNIIKRQLQKQNKIPTGINKLDKFLRGGFAKQELIMFAGSSGKGKSNLLVNFSYAALVHGKNVLFITAELDDIVVNERVNMRMCRATDESLFENIDKVSNYISKFYNNTDSKLLIQKIPMNKWSIDDIETFMNTLADVNSFVPDIVVVDYIDLLEKDNKYRDNYWVAEGKIAEDAKNLGKTFDIPFVTVTQCTKGVDEKFPPRAKDLSGSDEKLRKSDVTGVFCQPDSLKSDNVAALWMLKNRNNPILFNRIELNTANIDKMIITDLDYDYDFFPDKPKKKQ